MKQGRFSLLLLLLILLAGCRSNAANQELVERDMRWQEDQIYALNDQLCEYEKRLDACRRENDALRRQLGGGGSGSSSTPPIPSEPPGVRTPSLPSTPAPRRNGNDLGPPSLIPPVIQPGKPVPGSEDPLNKRSSYGTPSDVSQAAYEQAVVPADDHVTKIVLNRFITGGRNADGCCGDEGIMVVFEPKNEADQLVPVAGAVSIAVLDPAQYGEAARVARWDYSADEVQTHYRKTALTRGFQFDLRWPNRPPVHRDLTVYVRYETADGRKLVAEKDIRIELPDDSRDEAGNRTASADLGAVRLTEGTTDRGKPAATTARSRWSPTR